MALGAYIMENSSEIQIRSIIIFLSRLVSSLVLSHLFISRVILVNFCTIL